MRSPLEIHRAFTELQNEPLALSQRIKTQNTLRHTYQSTKVELIFYSPLSLLSPPCVCICVSSYTYTHALVSVCTHTFIWGMCMWKPQGNLSVCSSDTVTVWFFCFVLFFLIQGHLTVRPSNQQMAALPVVGFQAHVTIPVRHRGTWKSGLMLAYQAVYRLKLPLLFRGAEGSSDSSRKGFSM